MPRQKAPAELANAVTSPGFTAGLRDVPSLLELLDADDDEVADGAARSIVRAGLATVAAVTTRLASLSPRAKVRALRALGKLAPPGRAAAVAVLTELRSSDARVAKGAAQALGRLGGSEAREDIAAALADVVGGTAELPVQRAAAEALGKLGAQGARTRLEAVASIDPELSRIARNAAAVLRRDETRGEASEIDGEGAGRFDADVLFACRPGLERWVIEEVRERCPEARMVSRGAAGEVRASWHGALRELLTVRTALGFAFELPPRPLRGDDDLEAATIAALTSTEATRIVETWTRGAVRYRLDWRGKGHRRALTWRVVHGVTARKPAWVNDPTDSTWEASAEVHRGRLVVRLTPKKLVDRRFAYRLRDVPAASHPTIAAALVRASRSRPDDVVWDPFVGAAGELVERALAAPYRRLVGTDLDPRALDAAGENLAAAGVPRVTLERGDARTYAVAGVTSIITNPPMGRRVISDGTLAALMDAFVDHAARTLAPRGRLAWLSPLGGRTAARAEQSGLRVTLREPVDMGGFTAEMQLFER